MEEDNQSEHAIVAASNVGESEGHVSRGENETEGGDSENKDSAD